MKTFTLFSVNISSCRSDELISEMLDANRSNRGIKFAFANANLLTLARRDPAFVNCLHSFLVVNDGLGVDIANYLINRTSFTENLNGTDFIPKLLGALPNNCKIAIIGSTPDVNGKAVAEIREQYPQLDIVYARDGYFHGDAERQKCLQDVSQYQPELILVGMGNPLQEFFIEQMAANNQNAICVGVGALFDYVSGSTKRAPDSLRYLRLEWLYRLVKEPRRLWRRYTVDAIIFVCYALKASFLTMTGKH